MRTHRTTERGIVTTESGTDHSPTIVMVHGSLDRQATFARVASHLGDSHRIVLYDRRGYARSRQLGGPFTVEAHVEDLRSVVDGRSALLFGHSFGGAVSLAFAERYPEMVSGIAIYETPMSWLPFWTTQGSVSAEAASGKDPRDIAEGFMKRMIGHKRWESLPESTRHLRRAEGVALVGDITDLLRGPPYDLANIRCPVLSAAGSASHERFHRSARLVHEGCADSRLVVGEGWQHNAHVSHPGEFNETVLRPLIRRVETGRWDGPAST